MKSRYGTIIWDWLIVASTAVFLAAALIAPFAPHLVDSTLWSGMCHQIPHRCLAINDYAMPLCGRCTGIFAGFLLGRFYFGITRVSVMRLLAAAVLITVMCVEWWLEQSGWAASNEIRLASGVAFGVGYSYLFHIVPLNVLRGFSSSLVTGKLKAVLRVISAH